MTIKILALDTSMEKCSVALAIDSKIIAREVAAKEKQSELILPMIKSLLTDNNLTINELNAISFGRGPGSFTGARLAASITQGLSFSHNLPVIPVSTLKALAEGIYREHKDSYILIAVDAHLHEIYWAAYKVNDNGLMEPLIKDSLCQPEKITFVPDILNNTWSLAGDAWKTYEKILKEQCKNSGIKFTNNIYLEQSSHAYDIAKLATYDYNLGRTVRSEKALPNYLQNNIYKRSNKNANN